MRRNAFTLIEFVTVVAIICIMAAIIMPVFQRPHNDNRRGRCQSNLKQIALGIKQYIQDAGEKFPPVAVARSGYWAGSIQPYLKSWQIFQCPTAKNGAPKTTDYFYNARLSGLEEAKIDFISQTILAGDGSDDSPTSYALSNLPAAWSNDPKSPAMRHLDGANYVFADGHAKWLKPEKVTPATTRDGAFSFAIN